MLNPIGYQDTGCHLEPKCLECPRPISGCPTWGYGHPTDGDTNWRHKCDHDGIRAGLKEGLPVGKIAQMFGVSERTVRDIRKKTNDR